MGERNHHTAPSNTSRVCTLYLLSANGGHSSPPWFCISLWWDHVIFLGLGIVSLNTLTGNLITLSGALSRQRLAINKQTSSVEKNQPSFSGVVGSLHWTPMVLLYRWLLNARLLFTFHSETETQKIQARGKQMSSWVKIRQRVDKLAKIKLSSNDHQILMKPFLFFITSISREWNNFLRKKNLPHLTPV